MGASPGPSEESTPDGDGNGTARTFLPWLLLLLLLLLLSLLLLLPSARAERCFSTM